MKVQKRRKRKKTRLMERVKAAEAKHGRKVAGLIEVEADDAERLKNCMAILNTMKQLIMAQNALWRSLIQGLVASYELEEDEPGSYQLDLGEENEKVLLMAWEPEPEVEEVDEEEVEEDEDLIDEDPYEEDEIPSIHTLKRLRRSNKND